MLKIPTARLLALCAAGLLATGCVSTQDNGYYDSAPIYPGSYPSGGAYSTYPQAYPAYPVQPQFRHDDDRRRWLQERERERERDARQRDRERDRDRAAINQREREREARERDKWERERDARQHDARQKDARERERERERAQQQRREQLEREARERQHGQPFPEREDRGILRRKRD